LTYAIVIVVFAILVALLFIMRNKYSKLRSKHKQQTANKEGLDVSSWDDMVREHKY
jgi:hypothetical protein